MEDGYVVVLGSAGIDVKGRPNRTPQPGMSNPGIVRNTVGGVARNIAENLARLEVPTVLFTVLGHDSAGSRVLRKCQRAGVDCEYVQRIRGERTGTYMALLNPEGQLEVAVSDFAIIDQLNSDYIQEHREVLADAEMIVLDATIGDSTIETIFEIARESNVRVAADPTNPTMAGRLCPYIGDLYLVVPNAMETDALCGAVNRARDRESALQAARALVSLGATIAVVTLGEQGLAYADAGGGGYIRAINTRVVDTTGAGDAFSGAAIFGLLNNVPVDEAMRLGITAASLTLESTQTVLPTLNQELLYSKLMV